MSDGSRLVLTGTLRGEPEASSGLGRRSAMAPLNSASTTRSCAAGLHSLLHISAAMSNIRFLVSIAAAGNGHIGPAFDPEHVACWSRSLLARADILSSQYLQHADASMMTEPVLPSVASLLCVGKQWRQQPA